MAPVTASSCGLRSGGSALGACAGPAPHHRRIRLLLLCVLLPPCAALMLVSLAAWDHHSQQWLMQALSMHAPAMVPTVARVRTQVQPRQLLLPPALPDSMHQHAVPDLPPEQVSDIAGGHLMPSCSMPVPLLQQESALRELLALAWGTIPSKDAASSLGGMHAENASSRKARGGTFVMPAGGSPSVDMHGFGQQAPYILPLADMPDKEIALYRQRLEQYLYSSQFRQHAEKLLSVRRTTLSSTASSTGSVLDSPDVLSKGNGGTRTARSLAHRHLLPRGVLVVAGGPRLLANLVVLLKMLREVHRCMLPVEVAWIHAAEMDAATLSALTQRFAPLYGLDLAHAHVHVHEQQPHARPNTTLWGWQAKAFALLHTRFVQVLLLDADIVPLHSPCTWFSLSPLTTHGSMLWPDAWWSWVEAAVWRRLGLSRLRGKAALGSHDRDAESGAVLLDLAVHADVAQYVWLINSFADKLYWKGLHGDKDTFALAFAMAGKAHCYGQVQVHPGGAFHWGRGALEYKNKSQAPAGSDGRGDGWQLLGFTQHHPDTHTPLWLHRTMNKWGAPHSQDPVGGTELPWPVHLLTGPLPKDWCRYYLAHDSSGHTKGVWWEHVAPGSAVQMLRLEGAHGDQDQEHAWRCLMRLNKENGCKDVMSSGNHGSASKGKGLQHPDAYEGQIQGAAAVATEAGTTAADRVAPQLLAVPLCIGITRRGVRGCLEEYQQAAGPSDTQLSVKDSRRAQSPGPSAAPGSSGVTHGSGATSSQESRKEKEVTDCKQLLLPQPWCDALRVVHCHVPDASDVTIDSVICPVVSSQSPMPGLNKSTLGSASAAAVTRSAATSRYGSAATSTSAWMHNALAAVAASYDAYAWLLRHVHYYPGLTGGAA